MSDEQARQAVEGMKAQIARRCVYFSGVLDEQCKAGVIYASVRRAEPFPFLPCIRWPDPSKPDPPDSCAKRHFPTPDEVEKEHAEGIGAVLNFFEKLSQGLCPSCSKAVEPVKKVGRSLYAACGHRIGGTR